MAKQRILIVDDEEDICMILSYSLQKAGYDTLVAHSAEEALELLQSPIAHTPSPIDLILLDIMMGEMSGLEMAEKLRLSPNSLIASSPSSPHEASIPPIIFLTALSDEDTVLQGFKLGADDYISKPFRIAEVLARVAAVLRRTEASRREGDEVIRQEGENCIVFEGIVVNKADMSLKVDGEAVVMTRKEIELLCYLLTHRGQILSREHLLQNVWDSNGFVLERTVDVHITHLRKKLGQYGKRIVTKSGYGYMFSV
jgi:DNA-binding response OmpR family regulator